MRVQKGGLIVQVLCLLFLMGSTGPLLAELTPFLPQSTDLSAGMPGRTEDSGRIHSGSPIGSRFPISIVSNLVGHLHEWHSAVAYNSQWQQYLVVWDQGDGVGDNYIYGQFVSRNGALIESRFLIPAFSGINARPDLAYNPARNEYLVVYEHGPTPSSGIYGQRLDAFGTPVGTQITIASSTTDDYRDPAIAYEKSTERYLVVWQKSQGTAFSGIEARDLSGDGASLGGVIEITGMLANVWPEKPDVACTRSLEECLVVWQRWFDLGHIDHDIQGQRLHLAGGAHLEGGTVYIHYSTDDEINPAVAAIARDTGIGQYLVVCQYNGLGTWYTAGQSLTDAGTLDRWIMIGISNGSFHDVAGNENTQEYLVAWPTPAGTNMQARTVSTLGDLGATGLAGPPGAVPNSPAIASGPLGDYLVTWQDYYSGYPIDVFGYLWGNRLYLPLLIKS